MSKFNWRVRAGLAGMCAVVVTGCATYDRMQPAPSVGARIAVQLTSEELSGWSDLPIGAYRVPDSQVIVSGLQKNRHPGSNGVLMVLVVDAAEAHQASKAIEPSQAALHLRVDDELRADAIAAIADPTLADRLSLADGDHHPVDTLVVSPAIILTFVDDSKVLPFVVLKTDLRDAGGASRWSTRYFASTGVERPLDGDGGWLANGAAALKASISASLAQAVKVALADVAHPYARDAAKIVRVRAHVPYQPERFYLVGNSLTEDEHYLALATKVADGQVMAGVHIVDKSLATVTAATDEAVTSQDPADSPRRRAKAAKAAKIARRREAARAAHQPATAVSAAPAPLASAAVPQDVPDEPVEATAPAAAASAGIR